MLSAIQIKRHVFSRVEVLCDSTCPKAPESESYEVNLASTEPLKDEGDSLWRMALDLTFGPEDKGQPVRYQGHITVHGVFEVHPDFDQEKSLDLVRMNGGSLLMGAIRELVLTITARSARGPFELPTFDARMFLGASSDDSVKASGKS